MALNDPLNTKKQTAQTLNVSEFAISKWLSKGRLRGTKVGSRTMIRQSDILAFIASCNPAE